MAYLYDVFMTKVRTPCLSIDTKLTLKDLTMTEQLDQKGNSSKSVFNILDTAMFQPSRNVRKGLNVNI